MAEIIPEADIDSVIERLLEVRGSRPGKQVQLTETEIRYLCTKSREIFVNQPILLELEAPIKICGDIHGQYYDLLRLFEGNHECASINRIYGFYDECKRRYNIKLWKTFTDCFNCLPIAAIIDEKILYYMEVSPDLQSMEQIRRDVPLMFPILKHDLDLICRAHQVVEDGYEFFAKRQLVTLFSAPNYCGEFDNAGAMMSVDETLMCSFQILKPAEKKQKYAYGGMGTGRPVTPPRNKKKKEMAKTM
ncbi:hypothetical protein BSLG_005575 [Batrachochytrium salamandrivorans]|nr:hypothetical protein BSLG_005575 [Batrachochytrium salamandrivorans]